MVQRRAVIYARVSTGDQNCERQVRELGDYAARAGYQVMATFRETASGARNDRSERKKAIQMARERKIDAILVTELSRWGRSTQDLLDTLRELAVWKVSVVAPTGLDCDLTTPQGKLFLTVMAGISEFERDIISERVKSGLASAKARGKILGRKKGFTPSDKCANEVLVLIEQGQSYRWIANKLKISKTTVGAIVRRRYRETLVEDSDEPVYRSTAEQLPCTDELITG